MKKVIVVAGGSRGIGKYLVNKLWEDGYLVSTCSRNISFGETPTFLETQRDLTSPYEVGDFISATYEKFGRIDAAIYNAGIMEYADMLDVRAMDLDAMYEITIKGYLYICQTVVPIMREQNSGHIISISSIRGLTVTPDKLVYSAMKRAAISVTESVQVENEKYGIKATSIHLDTVDTASSRKRYGGKFNHLNLVKEEDVLKTVEFLLSLSPNATVDSILVRGKP